MVRRADATILTWIRITWCYFTFFTRISIVAVTDIMCIISTVFRFLIRRSNQNFIENSSEKSRILSYKVHHFDIHRYRNHLPVRTCLRNNFPYRYSFELMLSFLGRCCTTRHWNTRLFDCKMYWDQCSSCYYHKMAPHNFFPKSRTDNRNNSLRLL